MKEKSLFTLCLTCIILGLTAFGFNLAVLSKSIDTRIPVTLTKIVDGDTIRVKIYQEDFPVRLVGIDCFEASKNQRSYKQAYENKISVDEVVENGKNSKDFLENLYNNSDKKVYLDFLGIDKYGRALGIVWFENQNVNKLLLQNGGCIVYEYYKNSNK